MNKQLNICKKSELLKSYFNSDYIHYDECTQFSNNKCGVYIKVIKFNFILQYCFYINPKTANYRSKFCIIDSVKKEKIFHQKLNNCSFINSISEAKKSLYKFLNKNI